MDPITIMLRDQDMAIVKMRNLWGSIKQLLTGERVIVVEVKDATRSTEQNAKLHAMIGEISQKLTWPIKGGDKLDIEAWKRLFVCAFEREKNKSAELYPSLDGHGFDVVYRRTSKMGIKEMGELIEFVEYWAAQQGVYVNVSG